MVHCILGGCGNSGHEEEGGGADEFTFFLGPVLSAVGHHPLSDSSDTSPAGIAMPLLALTFMHSIHVCGSRSFSHDDLIAGHLVAAL